MLSGIGGAWVSQAKSCSKRFRYSNRTVIYSNRKLKFSWEEDRSSPSNYRAIWLTSICCKLMEHVLYSSIMSHLTQHQILCEQQYGFRQGRSCETQLINVVKDVQRALDQQKKVDLIMLDFKVIDTVPHQRLLCKLVLMVRCWNGYLSG